MRLSVHVSWAWLSPQRRSMPMSECLLRLDVQHIRSLQRLFEEDTMNDATFGRLESSRSSFFLASPPLAVVVVPSL